MHLGRIIAGDRDAFAEFVNGTWDDLVNHLTWVLGSEEAAEDAAQEAFVRLWERREQWREGSARALVFRIGRNVAYDLGRRRRVESRWASNEARTAAFVEGADDLAESSEYEQRLMEALAALSPGRREVIELVRLRGLTHQEAAEALSISKQTVANRVSLALADLRVLLADILPAPTTGLPSARSRETNDG